MVVLADRDGRASGHRDIYGHLGGPSSGQVGGWW